MGPEGEVIRPENEILPVPKGLYESDSAVYPRLAEYFNTSLYAKTRELAVTIERYLSQYDNKWARDFLSRSIFPILQTPPESASAIISNILGAPDCWTSLGGPREDQPVIRGMEALTDYFADKMRTINTPICPVVGPHNSDLAIINAAIECGIAPEKIGYLVLDRHFDGSVPSPVFLENGISASSTYIYYLLEGGIGGAAAVGTHEENYQLYRNRTVPFQDELIDLDTMVQLIRDDPEKYRRMSDNIEEIIDFYRQYAPFTDMYYIAQESAYTQRNGRISHRKLQEAVDRALIFLAQREVKYVLLSIDCDVLDLVGENFSASTYHPASNLISAGIQDIDLLLRDAGFSSLEDVKRTVKTYINEQQRHRKAEKQAARRPPFISREQERKNKLHELNWNFAGKRIEDGRLDTVLRRSIYKPTHFPEDTRLTNLRRYLGVTSYAPPPGGLSAWNVLQIIRQTREFCASAGLQFGIPPFTGVVAEYSGVDVGGRSAETVRQWANAMTAGR